MAKKTAPKKSHKKSETEDMPDVETEDMDDGDEEEEPGDRLEARRDEEEEPEAPEELPPPEEPSPEQGTGEPASPPPAGSPTTSVRIKGEGTIPIITEGSMTRLERGKNIQVTDAQLAALREAGEKFVDVLT